MFKRHLNPFYSPDDSATLDSGKLTADGIYDELGKDTPAEEDESLDLESDKSKGKEADKEDDKTDEEDKSLEDELEEEIKDEDKVKEEDLDEDIVVHVSRKEILAKYPNLFKDFPQINKAIYREQAYSEIVPTLEDAKIAVEKAETLDNFGKELEEGKTTNILKAVREESPESFNSLVDNYLGNLRDVDEGAYLHVLSNVLKHTIIAMANNPDEEIQAAATTLNKFAFRSDKFEPPTRLSNTQPKNEKEEELTKREENFRKEQLDTHVNSLNTRVENAIKSTIDKNIDPRESMTPFTRRQAMRECTEQLEEQIDKDVRFKSILDKMWDKAIESGFKADAIDKIRLAYLAKAKVLLPTIIKKVRYEALKGPGKSVLNDDGEVDRRRGPLPVGNSARKSNPNNRQPSTGNSEKDKARALPKGMKSIDYLMRD